MVPLGGGDRNEEVTASAFDTTGITYTGTITDLAKKAAVSYNRAVTTLNEVAEGYKDSQGYADRARCVGSDPSNPPDITETAYEVEDGATNEYIKTKGYNNKFKVADNIYSTDFNQMGTLGIRNVGQIYWLASRDVNAGSNSTSFRVRYVNSNGNGRLSYSDVFSVYKGGSFGPRIS